MRHHFFGHKMEAGANVYDPQALGRPVMACWSEGEEDLFIATRQGRAIRFPEQKVPFQGCLGIRLEEGDAIAGVSAVESESSVFLVGADGKGTIRLMSGFSANKAPGSGGKNAMKTEYLTGVLTVAPQDDIFIISRLSKIIRFRAEEVATTAGVVQGVNCMSLRADETVAAVKARMKDEDNTTSD